MCRRGQSLVLTFVMFVVAIGVATPAGAHIQVQPTEVAPADPVLFTILVPGEAEAGTTKVKLKIPPGVYPFSFEPTPGWKRTLLRKPNGLTEQIIWTGKAAPDGLVRFAFLAGTPERPGEITWPAIQTYGNGQESRWLGPPDSEHPAPVTVVSESVPRQNAGGEAASTDGGSSPPAVKESPPEEDTNWPLTIAALLGFFFGLSSLVILLVKQRSTG